MRPSPAPASASDSGMLGRRLALLPSAARVGTRRARMTLGCALVDHVAPQLTVASATLVGAREVIAAAAAASAGGSGAVHGAVASTLAQVAVTAVAIASGACLSTKVDFLWPRIEQLPDTLIFEGVEVTGYQIFEDPKAVNTVVAGILHDVIDDTSESLKSIEEQFGNDVASLVSGVSKLSYINQLLRRHRQKNTGGSSLTSEEANNLRVMLVGMVDDPRVVLIKLADRLHNMRTIYALPASKAEAVAQETLAVWCSLASRLGVWALKSELEDLCFAVLQPQIFKKMQSELTLMWNRTSKARSLRRSSIRSELLASMKDAHMMSAHDLYYNSCNQEKPNMKDLLQAVLPFDLFLDRKRRSYFLSNLNNTSGESILKPKIVDDAAVALASLAACEEELERELLISTSYIPGMEVTLSSRLKSLYSIYCKMKRKDKGIKQVYDARALRVIVGDKNGALHGPAVRSCYSILDIVHRLWTPIDGEFDDYIINPKGSGYQSLHTTVQASDSAPLEVQIRTQRMHEYAEYGLAAHWLYKESKAEYKSGMSKRIGQTTSYSSSSSEDETSIQDIPSKYSTMKVGHPVLRIEGSHLLAAVIVSIDKGGKELLVAVSFSLEASEAVAERRSSFQLKRWEAYARLHKKVSEKWWCAPGHGDWSTNLERYILCQDGIFHKQDQFGRLLPTFIQIINLTEEEEEEYWMVVSAIFEGKEASSLPSESGYADRSSSDPPTPLSDPINNKVHLLRTMLQWEEQVRRGASMAEQSLGVSTCTKPMLHEVAIIFWPNGKIMRMSTGSTAADAARRMGVEGKLIWVNGQLVLPQTELKDGDIVEVRV
ncbi:hypothetical protein EJB05_19621 [Eragrostis curvula]|uniref:RelA/SpoT domain-containing protein n=1 Tax=Eragrostis curvula TaxID=38414 RepID=A0A5J9UW67_9POAL|nr:hypothetical protein EJB05_19621 [Eragrostis curvula]